MLQEVIYLAPASIKVSVSIGWIDTAQFTERKNIEGVTRTLL